jgi:hypothetical protein
MKYVWLLYVFFILFVVVFTYFFMIILKKPIKKKKIVLITVLVGNYDSYVEYSNPKLPYITDAYVITDSNEISKDAKKKGWSVIKVRKEDDPRLQSKKYKNLMNFHPDLKILNKYDIVIYHDGNMHLHNPKILSEWIKMTETYDVIIPLHTHDGRNPTTIDEINTVVKNSKNGCNEKNKKKILQMFAKYNYKGIEQTCVTHIQIRTTNKRIKKFANEWYMYQKNTNCLRDQVFVDFVLNKNKIKYHYVDTRFNENEKYADKVPFIYRGNSGRGYHMRKKLN